METEQAGPGDADAERADSLAREIFPGVAGKWALLIINALAARTLRFTELKTEVEGISHKMLTQTLRGLERDGVVHRTVHATVPPRVDYRLTPAGGELRDTVNAMCAWTRRHLAEIEAARHRFARSGSENPG
ncbi:winged helix-turn-helix transcriptional regulator [Streptomyces sp. NPDC090109]|uniref:winged helix-turn-helix transcriptional regulator n=1 Tax=unclassified Streptomyces TaxID=2593676 RepID=UPI000EF7DB14|nr:MULTISPECIES: helix-turn-helix domain-containing protein [unclassified Streptomyces]MZE53236.1 transcriptional regulator [Streptomyces sp. SID5770]